MTMTTTQKKRVSKADHWFYAKSIAWQKQYVKDHPNSIYAKGMTADPKRQADVEKLRVQVDLLKRQSAEMGVEITRLGALRKKAKTPETKEYLRERITGLEKYLEKTQRKLKPLETRMKALVHKQVSRKK